MPDDASQNLAADAAEPARMRAHGRGRLFRKYVALFVAVVCVALLLNGAFEIWFSYQDHEASLIRIQREQAASAAAKIEQFVAEIQSQIGWTTELPWSGATLDQRRFDALRLLRQVPAITELSQLDATGKEQLRVSRLEMDVVGAATDYSHDPRFAEAVAHKAWYGPVYFRRESEPYMTLALAGTRRDAGVSVAEVNLKFIWDVVSQIKVGEHGEAYVVDADGRLIAHPDISLVLRNTNLTQLPQVAAARAGGTQDETQEAHNLAGHRVLTAYAKVQPLGWLIFVELPIAEAYAPLYASIERAGGLLILCLVLAFFAGLFLARRMVVPIQALREGALRIGGGDLGLRLSVKTGDEIEALADQFNDMAGQLQESYAGLERKVEDRTRELTESLEQQTATAEVLRVISSSPGELKPVFETMLDNATRICGAQTGMVYRFDGEAMVFVAGRGVATAFAEKVNRVVVPPNSEYGRMIRTKALVHVPDIAATPDYLDRLPNVVAGVEMHGARTVIYVPMCKEDELVGCFILHRKEVRPFTDKQIELVQNFAAQAVIAIENARLLTELRESLDQQTATSEVLSVISSSPGELAPVFETMLDNATRICEAQTGNLYRYDGEMMEMMASRGLGPDFIAKVTRAKPHPDQPFGRMIRTKALVHMPDLAASPEYLVERFPGTVASVELHGTRTCIFVPMLKEDVLVGAFVLNRHEVRPFTQKQIELVENFAAQAVIAIENARLLTELRESLDRQTATAEVLGVISSSPGDLAPVFETMLDNAARLCEAQQGVFFTYDGERFYLAASLNAAPEFVAQNQAGFAMPPESNLGRMLATRQAVQDLDLAASAGYRNRHPAAVAAVEGGGVRTCLHVPLLKDGTVTGAIVIFRTEVRGFDDKHVQVVKNFAAQAVIAIENARLLTELRQRTTDLQEALDYQTAISDVLKVISRSAVDLDAVLQTVVTSAIRLCRAERAGIYRKEGDAYRYAVGHDVSPEYARIERETPIMPGPGTLVGRAALAGRTVQIGDAWTDPLYEPKDDARVGNARSMLGVPLLREGTVIGVIGLARSTTEPYSEREVQLVTTFADQAVIAIENARLFSELRESLEQQTATAEVLGVISASPGELKPVFDSMLENAVRLCDASQGSLFRLAGGALHRVAARNLPADLSAVGEISIVNSGPPERMMRTRDTVHVHDLSAEIADNSGASMSGARIAVADGGARTILWVPLKKDDDVVGAFVVNRQEVRPFTDKEIALVENFAAQAVIAIENARLLTELRESLDRQTATAEVLGVISSSPGELQPVFETMLDNAVRLCDAAEGALFRISGNMRRRVATLGMVAELAGLAETPIAPDGPPGQMLRTKASVHIPDLAAILDDLKHSRDRSAHIAYERGGVRTVLWVPMVKDDEVVGAFVLNRHEVRPFTQKQIELVENFAAQAVIAIENARLLTELRESLDRQTATGEVLSVISSSPGELAPVFDVMLESALRICEAAHGTLFRVEDDAFVAAAQRGLRSELAQYLAEGPIRPRPEAPISVMRDRKETVQVPDLADTRSYRDGDPPVVSAVERGGVRTVLFVPMIAGDAVIGAIGIQRREVRAFSDKQIAMVENFASQAVIAIENARLLTDLRARTDELARSVEELRVLGEVSQSVNSTLDLQTVLTTIVANSVQLSKTDAGAIYVYDQGGEAFNLRATYGMGEDLIAAIRGQTIRIGTAIVGDAASTRAPVQIADLRAEPATPVTDLIIEAGFRALLVIPLLRSGDIVGALVVRRRAPGAFPASVIELLQTFAAQSVVAIQNAGLFSEIEEKGRELALASQHKSQFLANMSHELRTPLNAILGYTELILDDIYGAAPQKMRDVLERVQTNGKHLLGLINDVLDLSKIEAGQLVLTLADYSVKEMLQGVYVAVEPLASNKKLALKLDVPQGLPKAHGDERRLSQVVLNLVGNAIKFTDQGEIKISAVAENGGFVVSVKDTGPGIAPGDQAKIFEEFQQADNSATRAKGGTGLGLAISRRIVEMHGGKLWVESAPGSGSTFSFTLPITAAQQAGHA
ncbi:MAG TPA: GAF domain-containing protein [Stellaceae bacterium]|nr:GAF domain-containing protein [Stellaceae bacterium]